MVDQAEVVSQKTTYLVDRAIDAGINFFDTSNNYSFGQSEELLGAALVGKREQVVVSTKVRSPVGEGPNEQGLSRHFLIQAVEDSLRRMQTDYIDLRPVNNRLALRGIQPAQTKPVLTESPGPHTEFRNQQPRITQHTHLH